MRHRARNITRQQFFNPILLCIFLLTVGATIALSAPASLPDVRSIYERELERIDDDFDKAGRDHFAGYGTALDRVIDVFKRKGDLDGYDQAVAEKKRFLKERSIPEDEDQGVPEFVLKLRSRYRGAVVESEVNRDMAKEELARKYVGALEGLKRTLMTDDQITEAREVQREADSIKAGIEDLVIPGQKERTQETEEMCPVPPKRAQKPIQPARIEATQPSSVVASRPLFSGGILSGTQSEVDVHLPRQRKAYVLRGVYLVPPDHSLHVPAGTTLVADRGAQLLVKGSLVVEGTRQNPVVMKGKVTGTSSWEGILCKAPRRVELSGLHVSGAKVGVSVLSPQAEVSVNGCSFTCNGEGFTGRHPGESAQAYRFEHCLFSQNTAHGLHINHGIASLKHCTVTLNRVGIYHGRAVKLDAEKSVVAENKEYGIIAGSATGGGSLTMRNCAISGNGVDVALTRGFIEDADCKSCWWGQSTTRKLKQKGVLFNLSTISDQHDHSARGRVLLDDFLTAEPEDCGVERQPRPPVRKSSRGTPRPRTIEIWANQGKGTHLGDFDRGDSLTLQYIEGEWTHWKGSRPSLSPDAPEGYRLRIMGQPSDSELLLDVHVPPGTKNEPYHYEFERDLKDVRLTMGDSTTGDNAGYVVYKVTASR